VAGEEVFVSCALTGGMTVPGQSAAIPVTPDEIVESGIAAHDAGAAILRGGCSAWGAECAPPEESGKSFQPAGDPEALVVDLEPSREDRHDEPLPL
jgi:hypothetical protein